MNQAVEARGGGGGGAPPLPYRLTTLHPSPFTTAPPYSILETLPRETMIPSIFILLVASISFTVSNALFNYLMQRDSSVTEVFRQWSRVLWMSRAAHIVEAPSSAEAHRHTLTRHIVAVSVQPTPTTSPVELYDSAAFFRGIAAPSADGEEDALVIENLLHTPSSHHAYSRLHTPAPAPHTAGEMAAVYHAENPHAPVPAPVVTEALTNTMEAVRLESQRLIFRFHPYYIIFCSIKACAMLLYIQYHFDAIDGGWRRFCVCGAANIFSGLLTPVWEYFNVLLLPLDPQRAQSAVVKVDEEKTDTVFIVELLFRISSLELDDLPTVLTQGSSFVAFAAILVPMVLVFCAPGSIRYCWMYIPLWGVYALVRHLYYRGAGAPPSDAARYAAVVGMTNEMVKAMLMKIFTVFMVLFTVQSSFLLGLASAEGAAYGVGLRYAIANEWPMHRSDVASTFQKLCLVSQLML